MNAIITVKRMDILWKKESKRQNAFYVDCFANIDANVNDSVNNWLSNQDLSDKKHFSIKKMPQKRNRDSNRSTNLDLDVQLSPEVQLNFGAHEQFSCLANVLEIRENAKFGRHIVAKMDIDVGQIIAISEPFASAVCCSSSKQAYCITCCKINGNFITCENCTNATFCSDECQTFNQTHKLECNSIFHKIDSCGVKLTIQMILEAVNTYDCAENLMHHFEQLRHSTPPSTQHGLMLNLKTYINESTIFCACQSFQCLMTMDIIKTLFRKKREQRFLMHLVLHYSAIIPANAFDTQLDAAKTMDVKLIYCAISLMNHR